MNLRPSVHRRLRPVLLAAFLALLPLPAFQPEMTRTLDPDPGALVIIGGALSPENEAVYRAILEARSGDGPICVIGTASADPEGASATAVARIDRWGGVGTAQAYPLPEDAAEAAHDPRLLDALSTCSGFFFVGGSQSRIVSLFRDDPSPGSSGSLHAPGLTPAGALFLERWRAGAVVAGTSAGAAMMSDPMIAGGTSAGALRAGTGEGGVVLTPGLGFLPELLVDQHFLARGRIGRLLVAALAPEGVPLAAGIDEDTALLVRGTDLEVVGSSGVVLVDARARTSLPPGEPGGAPVGAYDDIRLELLGPGDRFSTLPGAPVHPAPGRVPLSAEGSATPGDGTVALPDGAAPVPGRPPHPGTPEAESAPDLFSPWVFLHTLEALGRGAGEGAGALPRRGFPGDFRSEGIAFEVGEGARLLLHPEPGFRALGRPGGAGAGVEGSTDGLSVGPFRVELRWAEMVGVGSAPHDPSIVLRDHDHR